MPRFYIKLYVENKYIRKLRKLFMFFSARFSCQIPIQNPDFENYDTINYNKLVHNASLHDHKPQIPTSLFAHIPNNYIVGILLLCSFIYMKKSF